VTPAEPIEADPAEARRAPYPVHRQPAILRTLRLTGRVDVADIAGQLRVTNETVRKDLVLLERQGLLRRVHGGGVPVNQLSFESNVSVRVENAREKDRIALRALVG
jgi:DeoR family fructose operon transcriptional repressor